MPNWVATSILINTDDENKLKQIAEDLRGADETDFDFNRLIPTPDDIFQGALGEAERKLYGDKNWYDWNCANWGTKWNACEVYWNDDNLLCFSTAWSPAVPIFYALSRKYPDIEFDIEYEDEGDCIKYRSQWLNGEMICETAIYPTELKCRGLRWLLGRSLS